MTGLARSGKDHAANYLAKHMQLHKYAFAEPLKTMLKSVFGDHFHEGDRSGICPETGKSYREMMQTLGTEWGRQLMDENVWVNLVDRRWREVETGEHLVMMPRDPGDERAGYPSYMAKGMVLSDVRFDSEAQWIRDHGGMVIMIVRPGVEPVGVAGHASEKGVSRGLIDAFVSNEGSLHDFDMALLELVSYLQGD